MTIYNYYLIIFDNNKRSPMHMLHLYIQHNTQYLEKPRAPACPTTPSLSVPCKSATCAWSPSC